MDVSDCSSSSSYDGIGIADYYSESEMTSHQTSSHTPKKKKNDFYSTGTTPNQPIRHAITGAKFGYFDGDRRYPFLVGSKQEKLLFKVRVTTGDDPNRDIVTLFYDEPAEFAKHRNVELSESIIEQWRKQVSDTQASYFTN